MKDINLVVVDSSVEVTSSIKEYFEVRSNISVVETFNEGKGALEYLTNKVDSYDVIIMDIILQNVDGLKLLSDLQAKNIDKKVIVLSSYISEEIVKKSLSKGANYYMLKPFSFDSLEDRIIDLIENNDAKIASQRNLDIEISEMLHNLGIPSHVRGYQYIREGIKYLYNKDSYVSYITKEVYPDIAIKYETTPSRVERAIRHAIEISWDRGDLNLMEELFGHSVDYDRSKPTNSEYINTLADRLKMDNGNLVR